MVWDATAYAVTAKAIGTVESNMRYGAVSSNDPITLGAYQWYGVRAADLLFRIQTEEPSIFAGFCPSTIQLDMLSHLADDKWWNSREITKDEAHDFYALLTDTAVKAIQDTVIGEDIDAYLLVADRYGLDKDTETLPVEFFCTVYHQSPRAASQICTNLPDKAKLDDIYKATLNNSIVGTYRSRQTTAYNIILAQDGTGISNDVDPDDNDGGDAGDEDTPNTGGDTIEGNESHILRKGNVLVLNRRDGTTLNFFKSAGMWVASEDTHSGGKYVDVNPDTDEGSPSTTPPINTEPGGPTGGGGSAAAQAVIDWARSKLGDYRYSQGPGRLNPPKSGYADCSGFLVYAFQHAANVSLGGTYTGNLCTKGTLIRDTTSSVSESIMEPGDLIFLRWGSSHRANSPFDHVEMYCESSSHTRISMGRTPGPTEASWDVDINSALSNGGRVMIRRYL